MKARVAGQFTARGKGLAAPRHRAAEGTRLIGLVDDLNVGGAVFQ